ncbi:MAG: hydrogenase expression/formation protein HypE [Methylohalobius sp.]|nr:hydrogenase expression/formation protein HypE [Methylohalobius sp.]
MTEANITLAHGSGGMAMHRLIRELFLEVFADAELSRLEDQARLPGMAGRLALTTDAFVVDPIFFPGGDIGRLAVCGTVNDLAVGGSNPLYLSCAFVLEEGLPLADLYRIVRSMKQAADEAGVRIVAGDTKVVPKGAADKVFITTCGVGEIPNGLELESTRIRPGDKILLSGPIGDHGAAVLAARGELGMDCPVASDCRPLNHLVAHLLTACPHGVRALRDPTRGGVAAVINEWAWACGGCLRVFEMHVPVREEVRGLCELLGIDPWHLACEGQFLAVVAPEVAESALAALRAHPDGREAALVGEVSALPARTAVLHTVLGGERLLDLPEGEPLPRIC